MSIKSPKTRHILDLSREEKQKFIDSFDLVLSDCDGVIWMVIEPIANTGPAINLIKNAGKQYTFISNNSTRTDSEYIQKFNKIGVMNVKPNDIIYPVKAITRYINTHFPGQPCLALTCTNFSDALKENGVNVVKPTIPPDVQQKDLPKFLTPTCEMAAVILDIHINLTYVELATAQQYLFQKDCRFIAGAIDDRIPLTKDLTILGFTGYINILTESCNKEALNFGKPSTLLGQYIMNNFQIEKPKRVLFVGDNLYMDIKFGAGLGFQTLFVLTGTHTMDEMLSLPLEDRPDYYADSMADFIAFFEDLKK